MIKPETAIAAVNPVVQFSNAVQRAATVSRLSREEKLGKVLHELQIYGLPDATPHKQPLITLVTKLIDTFAENDADVGTTSLTFHEIDKADIRPLREPVRRLPYGEIRAAVESEVDKLVSAGIVRKSISPWASIVVVVRKKDGGWRMCVDYRRLNAVTKFDSFPLPRLDKALDAFAGATVFSSLDLAMAYHQVPVKPVDVDKTAFITHVGLYEMIKMLYLAHLIFAAEVAQDSAKLQVLANWPKPTIIREMQSFLKFVNFYGDYIANATEMTSPLFDLTASKKKDDPVQL